MPKKSASAYSQMLKLVPMLSSDQPGEVSNAARAISRILTIAGMDWFGVAKVVADAVKAAPGKKPNDEVSERTADRTANSFKKKTGEWSIDGDETTYPIWSDLRFKDRKAWLKKMMVNNHWIDEDDERLVKELYRHYLEDRCPASRREERAFDHTISFLWRVGVRP